jgi:cyclophilin family peptidyl-prolyl cis-trans isomerase/HEAT repeat protein
MRHYAPLLFLSALAGGCAPDAGRDDPAVASYLAIVDAEDRRPTGGPALELLLEERENPDPVLRGAAIRALGRLERPDLLEAIAGGLGDPDPSVREAAVNAVAQAHWTADGDAALPTLLARVPVEDDPAVRGTLARSIGRLRLSAANRAEATATIVAISRSGAGEAPLPTRLGAALGLEALVRGAPDQGVSAEVAERLVELTETTAQGGAALDAARVRRLAVSALGQARRLDHALVVSALVDSDAQVGMVALRYVSLLPPDQRDDLLGRASTHVEPAIAIEALRALGRTPRTSSTCARLLDALSGEPRRPASVRIVAIDQLAQPCPDTDAQRSALRAATADAGAGGPLGSEWQPAAHALVALARLAPEDARSLVSMYATSTNHFIRAYAAQAGGVVEDLEALRALAGDEHPNVRTAAVATLFELEGHGIDDLLLAQLESDDPQLLMTAASLLEGASDAGRVAGRVLDALDRISTAERETWRDARRALLGRAAAVGDASLVGRLEPYLTDYDPLVATDAAAALEAWTGRSHEPAPRPLPRLPLPTPADLQAMDGARIVLHMRELGPIEIELHPRLATTNAARFRRLAREGYFDGLTFHRWAPNFVIQGGSPGANEYQGDGPFTRDEPGLLPHWRGTVGISTRGHDTGDGQIFVNLVDNVRLDHTYTIVGTVVEGMDVVDRVLEGAVIERAEVVAAR